MDKEIAKEIGKIAELVARLGGKYTLHTSSRSVHVVKSHLLFSMPEEAEVGFIDITKTRKAERIPRLRRLAERLRAELKAKP